MAGSPAPSRRQFLLGTAIVLGGTIATSCTSKDPGFPAKSGSSGNQSTFPSGPDLPAGETVHTIESLLERTPFYVAHRGSGDNWTEHSMQAYNGSAAHGLAALEISVNATLDGVFVCHHDTTLARLTGDARKISRLTLAELDGLSLDARQWLGPAAELQPIPALKDVLDKFAATHVIFIEDKQGTNAEMLLDLMDTYPDSRQHFVWKHSSRGAHTAAVQARGYRVWGYFDADQSGTFADVVPTLDLVGLSVDARDEVFRQLVGYGKPVIAWEVHTRSERDRLAALGVQGMMCSNIPYVCSDTALHTADTFSSGLRAAGDLPGVLDKGWGVQPIITASPPTLTMKSPGTGSYLMGSLCPVVKENYSLTVELRWPVWLPGPLQHAGIAFAQSTDRAYTADEGLPVPGYHVVVQPGGKLALYSQGHGAAEGTLLAAIQTEEVQAQQWLSLTVDISPDRIRIIRDQNPAWALEVEDARYRGGYVSVCKNYPEPLPVEFRAIAIV